MKKAIPSTYLKLSHVDHVLHRPDMYVGPTQRIRREEWVPVAREDGAHVMERREVEYSPGLLNIVDEILVNAADSYNRDASMTTLKISVLKNSTIKISNDGASIPFDVHETEGVRVPELIFGHLLAGQNFDDAEARMVGGKNGLGAKLTNVYSSRFEVDIRNGTHKYVQTWTDNMKSKTEPRVTACKSKPLVTISFRPDFSRFGGTDVDDDTRALILRRAYGLAAVLGKKKGGVKVFVDDARLPCSSLEDLAAMFDLDKKDLAIAETEEGWSVVVGLAPERAPPGTAISFVNAVETPRGGSHVAVVTDAVARAVVEAAARKKTVVKPQLVKSKAMVFVSARVPNPTFDSQLKECLTGRVNLPTLTPSFMKKAVGTVFDAVMTAAMAADAAKDQKKLKKSDGSKKSGVVGVPKLTDAEWAGTARSRECSLLVCEGDSAKALAIAGLAVVGRQRYGAWPLRGKLLNVRDTSTAVVAANAEIAALKRILGLQTGKTYADVGQLRYGSVVLMTDADADGTHIAALCQNFFGVFFPSLLKIPGFLKVFRTPVVRARKGHATTDFFAIGEYEAWKASGAAAGWAVKYYKGLGTSTAAEAREYFSDLDRHLKDFTWTQGADESLDRAFNKRRAEDRRTWIAEEQPGEASFAAKTVRIVDFIDKELVEFSRADLVRSIPSLVDGLKESQRKVLFAAFKRNLREDTKVAQFGAYAAEHTAYHHGEASLTATVVNMAQNFVGSNNLNLLVPSGQFGTRLMGGKDAASARYIFTRLDPATRKVFVESDDAILEYLDDDGMSIEPRWYCPVVPMILVNGAMGIGTGWSTNVPCYDPRAVIRATRAAILGTSADPLVPWYRGFAGSIVPGKQRGTYECTGVLEDGHVTELPIGVWTQDFKDFLDESGVRYLESHTEENVHFHLVSEYDEAKIRAKLRTLIRTTNMHLFDHRGTIRKYESPEDVLEAWIPVRREAYGKRKTRMLSDMDVACAVASSKARFIRDMIEDRVRVRGRSKADVEDELRSMSYYRHPTKGFSYLLDMSISTLTAERAERLDSEAADLEESRKSIADTSPDAMWLKDLDVLESNFFLSQ